MITINSKVELPENEDNTILKTTTIKVLGIIVYKRVSRWYYSGINPMDILK